MSPAHGRGFIALTDEAIAETLAAFGPSATHQTPAVRIRSFVFAPTLQKTLEQPGEVQGTWLEGSVTLISLAKST